MTRLLTVTAITFLLGSLLGCGGNDPVPVPQGLIEHGDPSVSAGEQQMIDRQRGQRGQTKPSVTADPATNSLIVYASEARAR